MAHASKPTRARDLGIPLRGEPGPANAITDVAGVLVGTVTLDRPATATSSQVLTGVTAILPRPITAGPLPVWAGQFDLNGNGEMTGSHWIREAGWFLGPVLLTNTHSVGIAHHAAVGWMIDRYPEHYRRHHAWAMPVVGETYDGLVNDICGRHVQESHVLAALDSASAVAPAEGNVGGGAGMQTYDFKGGTGTASRRVRIGSLAGTVGALVQSNFGARADLVVAGVPVGVLYPDGVVDLGDGVAEMGSIIVVVATDLPLSPSQLARVAKRAGLGIGRTGTRGGNGSGDMFLAFSTANATPQPPIGAAQPLVGAVEFLKDHWLDAVYGATVEAVEEAVLNALVAARSVATAKPPGQILHAIDHQRLRSILRAHDRLSR